MNKISKKNHLTESFKKYIDVKKYSEKLTKSFDFEKYLNKLNTSSFVENLQSKVEKLVETDSNQVFLKSSKFWASAITWSLMGGTAFAIGWLSIAKTDEVVIALGKLEPKGGVVNVQIPIDGVATEILVKEGQKIKKDQVLIRLDTEITEARNKSLQKTLDLNNTILNKFDYLVKEGAVSEIQYIQQLTKIEEIKNQIKANDIRSKYQEIISPIEGIVVELKPNGPGYVAKGSEPVISILPTGNLLAKVEIESRTIGFVKEGKLADISVDSFPATDFGVVEGKVTRISSDALPPDPVEGKGYRFPAEITLDTQYLKLKSGEKLALQAGMSLSANIKLRQVTYIQLLFNKFSDKANSLKSL